MRKYTKLEHEKGKLTCLISDLIKQNLRIHKYYARFKDSDFHKPIHKQYTDLISFTGELYTIHQKMIRAIEIMIESEKGPN